MENRPGKPKKPKNLLTEAFSIFIFGVALFCLAAFLSFSPQDSSPFVLSHAPIINACGRVGAWLAAIGIQVFGLATYVVPAALIFIATAIFKREGGLRLWITLGGMSLAVVALTVFLSLQWTTWPFSGAPILTGGLLGAWFAHHLVVQFNSLGASIVSLLVFALSVAVSTPLSIAHIGGATIKFVSLRTFRLLKFLITTLALALGILLIKLGHLLSRAMTKSLQYSLESLNAVWKNYRVSRTLVKTYEVENGELPIEKSQESTAELPVLPPADQIASGLVITLPEKNSSQKTAKPAGTRRGAWKLPSVEFLKKVPRVESSHNRDKLTENSRLLVQKFADFGMTGEVTAVRPGPVITLYEFKPGPGIKLSKIAALADDLSMALSAQNVRIVAPIPGKAVVGIEIPSENREAVLIREFIESSDFYGNTHAAIPLVMGKDISGKPYFSDLAPMPHLLCAGSTGSGKSVFMNSLICSLLYRFSPDEMRLILVDPKFIEFKSYQDIPHLLLPLVDDSKNASLALKWAVREMERRYRILAMMNAKNLTSYNEKVEEMGADVVHDLLLSEETQQENAASNRSGSDWIEAFEPDESGNPRIGKLPTIVIIIDELADLMMVAKKDVEISIARLSQKARAAGIHLVIATQRPSTDVITGLIKANLPARLSFKLTSYIDSRTILDRGGAERLLGQGDMLFIPPGGSQMIRLHGTYVDDEAISKITSFLRSQGKPAYRDEILVDDEEEDSFEGEESEFGELFDDAVQLSRQRSHISTSALQRHFRIGYNRAANLIELMEQRGVVGPADGARPREVLK